MRKKYSVCGFIITLLLSQPLFALSCKQSESVPLAKAHEQTNLLSAQFTQIQHIEVLSQRIIPEKNGFSVETVQVLMCGDLLSLTPTLATTPGQGCQFDSHCASPMRCQNTQCVVPPQ